MPQYFDYLSIHMENKVLAELFQKFSGNIDDTIFCSWKIQYDSAGNPIGVNYENYETAPYPEYYDLNQFTDFIFQTLLYNDEIEGAEDLPELIEQNADAINDNYQKIESCYFATISRGSMGPAEDAVKDAVKRWGFEAVDQDNPSFEKEVRKWELISEFEMYTGLDPAEVKNNIPYALINGNPDLLIEDVFDRNMRNMCYTPESGWIETGNPEPDRTGKDYEEYQLLLKNETEEANTKLNPILASAPTIKITCGNVDAKIRIPSNMQIHSDTLKGDLILPMRGDKKDDILLEILPENTTYYDAEFAVVLYDPIYIEKGDFVFEYGSEQQIDNFWKDQFLLQSAKHDFKTSSCVILNSKYKKMLLLGSYTATDSSYPFGIVLNNKIYFGYILSDQIKSNLLSAWLEELIQL